MIILKKMKKLLWCVALVLGTSAFIGCSEETMDGPGDGGQQGGDSIQGTPKEYLGVTTFAGKLLRVADVVVKAEAGGVELFADTLTCEDQTSFGTDSLYDRLVLEASLYQFDPATHFVYYRNLGTPVQDVVWTATSMLNTDKVAALTDTLVTVSRPWNGFLVVKGFADQTSFGIESMTMRKSQLERYFEDARHTLRTDTLFVR